MLVGGWFARMWLVGGWFARRWLVDARGGKTNERSAFLFLHYDRWRLSLKHLKVRFKQNDEQTFLTVDNFQIVKVQPERSTRYQLNNLIS